jgi:hypothetical protein
MTNQSPPAALQRFSDPKATAFALCFPDARLHPVERDPNDRIVWAVSGLPADYALRLANDELPPVSPRAALVALEMTLGMVADHQRARRGGRR